jgi:AcrR family transcriptional regulator
MQANGSPRASGTGLRERKKAKTKAAIQQHALRLFQELGYEETTVEQIAEAAEVSPSTFFRYFPTKEDVVLYDALDPVLLEAFRSQPATLSPIAALRAAIRSVFSRMTPSELEQMRERALLVLSVPALRAAPLEQMLASVQLLVDALAERVGRSPRDFEVRVFVGAFAGAWLGAMLEWMEDPKADLVALFDACFTYLEAGLPL